MSDPERPIQVLLVDDEENIHKSLRRLLMDEEFELHTASSGQEGLEVLKGLANVGLIVSDQRMPGMNGAEFLGRSREIVPNALRILLTGYSDINATIDAINKGGAYRYISKPWNDEELVQTVRDAVLQFSHDDEKRRLNELINRQNKELGDWNESLKKRLLQTTATIREKTQALKSVDLKDPLITFNQAFDNFFEVMGDRNAVHARTVCTLVTDVVQKMGLESEAVTVIRLAALLHDAGKFGSLAGSLHTHIEEMSESELADYCQHTLRGEEMFQKVEEFKEVASLIRWHHESYDGRGFPDGLKGGEIPLGARLIAIADHIDNSARSVDQNRADYALMNANYHASTKLDPLLVAKFQGITRIVFYDGRKMGEILEVEVNPIDLTAGMTIARDVVTDTGVLLLQRGAVLDDAGIVLIRRNCKMGRLPQGVFIRITED